MVAELHNPLKKILGFGNYTSEANSGYLSSFVGGIPGPQCYFFLPASHVDNCSTDLITVLELFSDQSQQLVEQKIYRRD